jgi:hypothetical protein
VIAVAGCLFARSSAVDSPNTPAPTMTTLLGKDAGDDMFVI